MSDGSVNSPDVDPAMSNETIQAPAGAHSNHDQRQDENGHERCRNFGEFFSKSCLNSMEDPEDRTKQQSAECKQNQIQHHS